MGNKMCKKKTDKVDNPKSTTATATTPVPSAIDRIISRLHLRPNSWKSDSNLNAKRVNRSGTVQSESKNGIVITPQLNAKSKSSDWTEASLEVPEKEAIHLKNPQLSFIFNDNSTPTPPPRKHKKSIREKIESVAKNSIQALQSIKSNDESKKPQQPENLTPAEEELCVKKTIYYGCPCGNGEFCHHQKVHKVDVAKSHEKKDSKRKKNLSVISLPNYNELKFSIANSEDSDLRHIDSSTNDSSSSLPSEEKQQGGKLENYMTRCRSFGSLLNNKLKVPKEPADVESDDSFGGLEDWDLGILEHYNPKDASLPRPRKPKIKENVLSDMEKLIVSDNEVAKTVESPPVRPVRRSESMNKNKVTLDSKAALDDPAVKNGGHPDLLIAKSEDRSPTKTAENQEVEHSTLMKILQKYSSREAQESRNGERTEKVTHSTAPVITHLSEKTKPQIINATENFITAEKQLC